MSRRSWSYIWIVLLSGLVLSLLAVPGIPGAPSQWITLLALIILSTSAHLSKAIGAGHEAWNANLVFLFAGLLLLHPLLFVLLVIVPHAIEWIMERLAKSSNLPHWYIQPFNIAVHVVAGFAARGAQLLLNPQAGLFEPAAVVAIVISALIYVLLNHVLIGGAIVLARSVSWRESGVLDLENLITDCILLLMGYILAALWQFTPWLAVVSLAPLVLIYRALAIPQLKREAQTDGKTGLWNAQHIVKLFQAELARARRMNRTLAVIMADLDLLRNINNTYGHLAGDAVLAGLGQLIRTTIRQYDLAGRFGGEEFLVILPEATPAEAEAIAERLRQAVEVTAFAVPTSRTPIHATMSLGVACFPGHATQPNDLIHKADVAVYFAKLKGRNCVVLASDVPDTFSLNRGILEDRLSTSLATGFVPRPETPTSLGGD